MNRVRRWRVHREGLAIGVAYADASCGSTGRASLVVNGRRVDESRGLLFVGGARLLLAASVSIGDRAVPVYAVISPAVVYSSRAPFCHILVDGELVGGNIDRVLEVGEWGEWEAAVSLRAWAKGVVVGVLAAVIGMLPFLLILARPWTTVLGWAVLYGAAITFTIGAWRYLSGWWFLRRASRAFVEPAVTTPARVRVRYR